MPIAFEPGETKELNIQLLALLPATATLYGRVTDADTGVPLHMVAVTVGSIPGTTGVDRWIAPTDTNGYYEVTNIPAGTYPIHFRLEGYEPLEL